MNNRSNPPWSPVPHPAWLDAINREGQVFDLPAVIPLDADSLLAQACAATGLSDFGDERWREPFRVLLKALEDEARLTLMGRLMARSDIGQWLRNRLQITETLKQHPEIQDEEINSPMFITGLPRSGTSILFELLARDPHVGVPRSWEALMPCPPPESSSYRSDPRIAQVHQLFTQWHRVAPEFAGMHELGGEIPAECGLIMANTFISEHIAALHQTPSYSQWYAQADFDPVYEYHRTGLKILQWKNPRQRWLLKAPEHQVHLDSLLRIYPDAHIVQTHRDPIVCMASTTSLIGTLYRMRSEQAFDAALFEHIVLGKATAQRLEKVMAQRQQWLIPATRIADSRYQDLMANPLACISTIYDHFDLVLGDDAKARMQNYLEAKPKDKQGAHSYPINAEKTASERPLFARYQHQYGVPSEA